jgi:ribosomal protein S6--L-glutamate ligase
MSASGSILTMIYRPDDFEPSYSAAAADAVARVAAVDAAHNGFEFRMVPLGDLVPACTGRPQLWYRGQDLLQDPQCFQVDDFSWEPQTSHALKAICRTVQASDSVLLNQSFEAADYLAVDKLAIIQHAAGLGIPTAPTVCVPAGRYARTVLPLVHEHIGAGPYIVKPRELGMGIAVLKVDTPEQLQATLDIVAQSGIGYLIQPHLPNSGDTRVFIIDGAIAATQQRTPPPGTYRANTSQGARSSRSDAHHELHSRSQVIARSLGAECLQVDWLITEQGPILNEWSGGFGGYSALVEPDRTHVGNAFYAWAQSKLDQRRAQT